MDPYRVEIRLTYAGVTLKETEEAYDRVLQGAEVFGFHFEGGLLEKMDPDDVVEGSPLDIELGSR